MILKIYTVYDEKAKAYLQPFFQVNDDMAIRILESSLIEGKSNFAVHPQDYTLYSLGEFDDNTSKIVYEKALVLGLIELKARLEKHEISNEAPVLSGATGKNSA